MEAEGKCEVGHAVKAFRFMTIRNENDVKFPSSNSKFYIIAYKGLNLVILN